MYQSEQNRTHTKTSHWCLFVILFFLISIPGWSNHPLLKVPNVAATNASAEGNAVGPRDYVLFESGPVRPLAISHSRQQLYAANTPDGQLEVFAITDIGLVHQHSIPVGIEPVAIAVAPNNDIWVVNHISDSISIVDVNSPSPFVKKTLWVGDEPRDIVFAGNERQRAFITTAHRGQNSPVDAQSTVPGIGRADVWVFDSIDLGTNAGGEPLEILTLFGDSPRALAVSPDGAIVYAAVLHSGNRTTTLPPASFPKPPPLTSADGVGQPDTGLIVQFNGTNWVDETGQNLSARVGFSLPDQDVFAIDASTNPPRQVRAYTTVGTTLFNMVVNPINGDIYVSNTEAQNQVRFSGIRERAVTSVRGHIADNRITVIRNDQVMPRRLNKHIDFSRRFGNQEERESSLSMPLEMVVSNNGEQLYVTAFGSNKVAVFDTEELAADSFIPNGDSHIELSGGGPAGIVLDEARDRLYVLTRFNNSVTVVDLSQSAEIQQLALYNPEPQHIVAGRPLMYDAQLTSSRGNDSCASCHVFGNVDALAWDLGDPSGMVKPIPNSYHPITASHPGLNFTFHPMKGPMTTQSMRGLKRHGPMHWRGDRTGINRIPGESLESAAFKEFNEAFMGLLARESELDTEQMQALTDFAMELTYPPNPHRTLNNSLSPDQAVGESMFLQGFARPNRAVEPCAQCHTLDPAMGLFGTSGLMSFNDQPGEKDFKIPHFRDQYQKVGMFTPSLVNPFISGPQVRGFGFNHNGATSSSAILAEFFLSADRFRQIREYLIAFPTESPPILGQQVTVSRVNFDQAQARMQMLINRAKVQRPLPECDLIVQTVSEGRQRAWLYNRDSAQFVADSNLLAPLSETTLITSIQNSDNTYLLTCAPWGSGQRMALDRDTDGVMNGDEYAQGSDPDDAQSNSFRPQSGMWFNPQRSGHGIDLQRVGEILGATWFTYLEDGRPVWYQAVAPLAKNWSAPLLMYRWDEQTQRAESRVIGNLELIFSQPNQATMNWVIGERSGSEAFMPFRFDEGLATPNFTGLWFDPELSGAGYSLISMGDLRIAVAHVYDGQGEPVWAIGVSENALQNSVAMSRLSGPCPHCEFMPTSMQPAGTATFNFDGLRSGQLDISVTSEDDAIWQQNGALIRPLSDAIR